MSVRHHTGLGRRRFLQAGAGVVAATAAVGLAAPGRARAEEPFPLGESVDLGVAMTSVNTRVGTAGRLPDGTPALFLTSQGSPTTFNVVNALDGSQVSSYTFDEATGANSIVVSPVDPTLVYIGVRGGGHSHLYRYDTSTDDMELLVTDPAGQAMIRTMVVDDAGRVHASTYPDAKVFSYDPDSGSVTDHGRMPDDDSSLYAWGFDRIGDKVWVGTGIGTAHLYELDLTTSEKTEIALPPLAAEATHIHSIAHRGSTVIVVFTPSKDGANSIVYDLDRKEWMTGSPLGAISLNGSITDADDNGICHYLKYTDGVAEVTAWDPAERSITPTGWADTELAEDRTGLQELIHLDLADDDTGRTVVVGLVSTGRYWWYDPASQDRDLVVADLLGSPVNVHTLDCGPEGNIWTGAHLSSGVMSMIDTRDDTVHQFIGPSQADAVTAFRGKIVVGTYPSAGVWTGDVHDEWDWGTNPSELFTLGRHSEYGQDRPRILISAGRQVAMGTVPNYGELGGALTLFDLSGEFAVHRNVLPDQSIVALAHHAGRIVGGGSIDGGLSSIPRATAPEVFIWDIRAGKRVFHEVADDGDDARCVGALCVGPGGHVWGLTDSGVLLEIDALEGRVLRRVPGAPRTGTAWGSSTYLQYRKQDGKLYGANGARMFVFDPATDEMTWNMEYTVGRIVVNHRGQIYFSKGSHVHRFLPHDG